MTSADNRPAKLAECDLLIVNGHVLPMDDDGRTYRPGALAITAGRIVAVGAERDIVPAFVAHRKIDAGDMLVHPGFVDAHAHLSLTFFRGALSPEHQTLEEGIPLEGALTNAMTDEDEHLGAVLSTLEMARNGTTCFMDPGTVLEPDAAAAGIRRVGIRGSLADPFVADLGGWGEQPQRTPPGLDRALSVLGTQTRRNAEPDALVRGHVAVYGGGSCSNELALAASQVAETTGATFTFHHAFGREDAKACDRVSGGLTLVRYAELGVLGPHCNLVHMNAVRDEEVDAVVDCGASVTWCPSASMYYGVGGTFRGKHLEFSRQGVTVALGSDAADCSPGFDIGFEAFLAILTAREKAGRNALTADDGFVMATRAGARAVGLADEIGVLAAGRRADVVIRRASLPESQPRFDTGTAGGDACLSTAPLRSALYGLGGSRTVDIVIVAGEVILESGRSTRVDEEQVYADVSAAARLLIARVRG